jgi:hypothetical protein
LPNEILRRFESQHCELPDFAGLKRPIPTLWGDDFWGIRGPTWSNFELLATIIKAEEEQTITTENRSSQRVNGVASNLNFQSAAIRDYLAESVGVAFFAFVWSSLRTNISSHFSNASDSLPSG